MENVQLIKSPIPFIMMLVYIAVVMVMAWYQGFSKMARERKKNQTFEDYMTAGKSRNAVIVFLITIVTFYSGTTFTGRVGFFYNFGVAGLGSVIVCSATGMVMFFLSEKVWPIAKKYRLSTLPDIMELRYQSRWVKFFVSLIIVCFNIIWLITEIRTLGLAVNLASGGAIATEIGSAIAFAIIILYVATGGVHSVSMVDSFSACVMLGGSLRGYVPVRRHCRPDAVCRPDPGVHFCPGKLWKLQFTLLDLQHRSGYDCYAGLPL